MKKHINDRLALSVVATCVSFMMALPGFSQVNDVEIALHIPGLKGGTIVAGPYAGDVGLLSYSQTFSKNNNGTNCGAISITKGVDATSTSFLFAAVTGLVVPTATIYFLTGTGPTTWVSNYTITLTNVVVTSISQGQTNIGAMGLTDNISLSAQKYQFAFAQPGNPTGNLQTIGYDCLTQTTF